MIFAKEIFSAIPNNPIVVVRIRIIGPTRAKLVFNTRAFSMLFDLRMRKATMISILPDNMRKRDIPIIAFSKIENIVFLLSLESSQQYMQM